MGLPFTLSMLSCRLGARAVPGLPVPVGNGYPGVLGSRGLNVDVDGGRVARAGLVGDAGRECEFGGREGFAGDGEAGIRPIVRDWGDIRRTVT